MYNFVNPFASWNAMNMSSEQVLKHFISPYAFLGITENEIISDTQAIILSGVRGCGKTMLMKQFSYNVRKLISNTESYYEHVKEDKYLGIYFRLDDDRLYSLASFNLKNSSNSEYNIFTHIFELSIFKEYIEVMTIFLDEEKNKISEVEIVKELLSLFSSKERPDISNIDDLLDFVIQEINYVFDFKSSKAIDINDEIKFEPKCGLICNGQLINGFVRAKILEKIDLGETRILLFIDSFEEFSKEQQKVINTMMRFSNASSVFLRIGMRPYGFKTLETINNEEVKLGREFRPIEFNNPLVFKEAEYLKFCKEIAHQRLSSTEMFKKHDIINILGESESLVNEAKKIVKNGKRHIEAYLKKINKKFRIELDIDKVSYLKDDNPLIEMICLRLLLAGKSKEFVEKALNDHKANIKSEESKKFANDYNNKYKLSFVFVLCSIYKKEKKEYYGFKDYCLLSSGIVGQFVRLCCITFNLASFKGREDLIEGKISSEIQTEAAYVMSREEMDYINSIPEFGRKLSIFIKNIGSAFRALHSEIETRYPETNLFSKTTLLPENEKLLETALRWSLIIKKPNSQNINGKVEDIFLLNRIFAPNYKISCRTRGGFNPVVVDDNYFNNDYKDPKVFKNTEDNYLTENTLFNLG
ncbi:MAG: hypothetical protein LBC85_00840 [Fibromonadaceae bacterium]|jgi:hypothetical protein|nr:hypothetical protein [Fibromonadaceae bacterium]